MAKNKYGYCEYCGKPLTKKGKFCNKQCFYDSMRKTTEQYKQEVREALGDEYIVVGEYTRAIDKIEIKHAVCGRLFYPRAKELLSGKWLCPYCASNAKKDTEKFKKEVFKLVGNEYSVLGEYVNANTHITMKHNKCGHTWNVIPYNFIGKSQNRCPRCYGNNKKAPNGTSELYTSYGKASIRF